MTLTAVVATTGTGTPGGTVTFTIDGTAQTPAALTLVGGQDVAAFSTSTLTLGHHTITAAYSGGDNLDTSTSNSLDLPVLTAASAGAPTLAASSDTGVSNSDGITKDNGSAAAPLTFNIPNPDGTLFYSLYDVTNPASPVLLAGPAQLSSGAITVSGHTLSDGTHQIAYTTAGSAGGTQGAMSAAGAVTIQSSLHVVSINPAGNYIFSLPNNQVVVTFNGPIAGLTADKADGSGFTSQPFAVTLTPAVPMARPPPH